MNDDEYGTNFWLGNTILAAALLMLLYMGYLWELMGAFAMVIWVALAATGAYLLMSKKGDGPTNPD